MLSINKAKFIRSLNQKKGRSAHKCFVVEGRKCMEEALKSRLEIIDVFTIEEQSFPSVLISQKELSQVSALSSNNYGLVVAAIPESALCKGKSSITLCLDNINDPGNLGNILRIADWYGITNVVCSASTVDCYNPKVIQASMGSIFHVNVLYEDLSVFLKNISGIKIGAYLEGESIYDFKASDEELTVVMGSESHGISAELESLIDTKVTIPRKGKAESLNVGNATAILMDNLVRG